MSVLRRLAFLTLIACGLATATWSEVRGPAAAQAAGRKVQQEHNEIWIDYVRN